MTIPGVHERTVQAILAEPGPDMARFAAAERLVSWAGLCPGNNESGGKRRAGRRRSGPVWLGIHLYESAKSAGRTATYLGAQYRRLRARRGASKATKAVEHSILVAVYHMFTLDVAYQDLGADWFERRNPQAHARRLIQQLNHLGYRVELTPIEAA